MKTTTDTDRHSLFFQGTYKTLKYFLLGSIGFMITYMFPLIFDIKIIPFEICMVLVHIFLRLGITLIVMLGAATVYESWR